ncbi:MAG: hypothetical protein ACOH18_00630 [Candidatus Saccharimonadaceae bacterium]
MVTRVYWKQEVFMETGSDLSHVGKLIEKYTVDARFDREQAVIQRARADQKRRDGDSGTAEYFEQEANRFERQADEYENWVDQLQNRKKQLEQRLKELENQRAHVDSTHTDRIKQLDNEISQVRGSGMML